VRRDSSRVAYASIRFSTSLACDAELSRIFAVGLHHFGPVVFDRLYFIGCERSARHSYSRLVSYRNMGDMSQDGEVMNVLRDAKTLAQKYRALTGKPLGITGEVAEYEAARILGLELTAARQAGYDAIEKHDGVTRRLQIKGRCLLPGCEPGQRLGSIDILKGWDSVILVLLDENFDATAHGLCMPMPYSRLNRSRKGTGGARIF
jgi:hypothetical protein